MKQHGVALILVLWILSILILMASSFSLTMRRESAGVMTIKANAEANAQARSALTLAQAMLLLEDETKRWRIDGSIYEIETENATTRIQILSETGKIDINSVSTTLFHQVMMHAPIESQAQVNLENAILDWRDADEDTRVFGAEKKEYHTAKLDYSPRNKPFRSLEELQMVHGMTKEVFDWMKPLFTIYSAGQTEVDLNLASREVLSVLPEVDANLLDSYFQARQKSILNHTPFPVIPRSENANQAMSQDMEATTEDIPVPEISVVSVVIETILENEARATIHVVMEKLDGANNLPFQILTWQNEIDEMETSLFDDEMDEFVVLHLNEEESI